MNETQTQELETNNAAVAAQSPLAARNGNSIDRRKPKVVASTEKAINNLLQGGRLVVPTDYSVENALAAAWLILQTVQDKDRRPALEVCTDVSIQNALFDMCVQGLNPAKKQCYFIVYGTGLVCQRSYFGDIALAQRVRPGIDVTSAVVYNGDEFDFGIKDGRQTIFIHKTSLESQEAGGIRAAYAIVLNEDGIPERCEVMTIDQIKKSWGMSKTYRPNPEKGKESTHHKFESDMAMRTVIRKVCKPIINSSNDACLADAMRRQDEIQAEADFAEEVAANANGQVIDIEIEPELEEEPTATEEESVNGPAEQPTLDEEEAGPGY